MSKFVANNSRLDTPAAVQAYWQRYREAQAAAPRQPTSTTKEAPMPVTKSVSDVAWSAVSAAARDMVAAKQAPDFESAIRQLRLTNHPVYLTYLAAMSPGSTPPTTTPDDVLKRANAEALAKKRTVDAEVQKCVDATVRSGQALTTDEALGKVFKRYPHLYEEWREANYAKGPLADVPREGNTLAPTPVYDAVRAMAFEMKQHDRWGEHVGKSESEMCGEVLRDPRNRALYQAYREESYSRL